MKKFPYPIQDGEPSLWTHVEGTASLDWISWFDWHVNRLNGLPHGPVYTLINPTPARVQVATNLKNNLEALLQDSSANYQFEVEEPRMILPDRFQFSMAWVVNVSYLDKIPPTEAVRFGIALQHQEEASRGAKAKVIMQVKTVLGNLPLKDLLAIHDQLPKGNTFSYYNYTPTLVIGMDHLELVQQELRSRAQ